MEAECRDDDLLNVLYGLEGYSVAVEEEMVLENEASDGAYVYVFRGELCECECEVVGIVWDLAERVESL